MSKISIGIVTYNSEKVIQDCLQALSQQEEAFEVYVVDNASTDETVACVKRLGIPVVVNPVNVGYAAAHNQIIRMTQSDYVLTLNPDVLLQPGYLRAMRQTLDTHPEVGIAAGCLLRVNTLGETPYAVDSIGLWMNRRRRQGLLLDNAPLTDVPNQTRYVFGADGAAAFYRRSMLEDIAVNGEVFDEDFFIHKEDVDLCWRSQLRGWKSLYVPQAQAHHIRTFRPGQRTHVYPYLKMCAVRNRYLLMLKNDITALFWRDFLHIASYDVLIILFIVLREQRSLKGLVSAWQMRHKMLDKRRIIQSRRRVSADDIAPLFRDQR